MIRETSTPICGTRRGHLNTARLRRQPINGPSVSLRRGRTVMRGTMMGWPAFYLVLSALAFWQYVRGGETVEVIHFAIAGSVLEALGIIELFLPRLLKRPPP